MNYVKRIADIMAYALCAVVLAALISLAFYVGAHAADMGADMRAAPYAWAPAAQPVADNPLNQYRAYVTRYGARCDMVVRVEADDYATLLRIYCDNGRIVSYAVFPGYPPVGVVSEAHYAELVRAARIERLKDQLRGR